MKRKLGWIFWIRSKIRFRRCGCWCVRSDALSVHWQVNFRVVPSNTKSLKTSRFLPGNWICTYNATIDERYLKRIHTIGQTHGLVDFVSSYLQSVCRKPTHQWFLFDQFCSQYNTHIIVFKLKVFTQFYINIQPYSSISPLYCFLSDEWKSILIIHSFETKKTLIIVCQRFSTSLKI